MMTGKLCWKIDVKQALIDKGYNTNTIRKEKILSESTLQKLRMGEGLSWDNIEILCGLLELQPADLMEFREDKDSTEIPKRKNRIQKTETTADQSAS